MDRLQETCRVLDETAATLVTCFLGSVLYHAQKAVLDKVGGWVGEAYSRGWVGSRDLEDVLICDHG